MSSGRFYNKVAAAMNEKKERDERDKAGAQGTDALDQKTGVLNTENTPSRARVVRTNRPRASSMSESRKEVTPINNRTDKDRTEKRKKADGDKERNKRCTNGEGDKPEDKSEEEKEEEEEENGMDETITEFKKKEENESKWNENMEETIDKGSITEIKMLLKQVMLDYRLRIKELEKEKEKEKRERIDNAALKKGLEEMKAIRQEFEGVEKYVDESNEKWRTGINEELGKMNAEIQQVKNEMETLKERETNTDPGIEEMKKEVEELKK